jgi:hypothetical protein
MAKERPIAKADAARERGVTRGAVSLACRAGGALYAALLPGGRLNRAHPAYLAWLGGSDGARTKATAPPEKTEPRETESRPKTPKASRSARGARHGQSAPVLDANGYAEELKDWTLSEIVNRYGTVRGYGDHLQAYERKARANRTRLENEEREGSVVSRTLIEAVIFGYIETAHRRLLSDIPKTSARLVYAAAKAGEPVEEAEQVILERMSSVLKTLKLNAARALRERAPRPHGE